jgi:hypothetical protein
MSNTTFPFGYKDYNDAMHNGVLYTQSELQNVKIGDKVIVLTMTDSDDDYSLENRLFEFTVDSVTPDGFDAGGFWVDLPNFSFEYFLILRPKYSRESVITETDLESVKPLVIGNFKTKNRFIDFIGGSNNINFISNEAYIEGKQLSGLDYDGIRFKLTICDEGTVNFEEVGTNHTTSEQRQRLLELISDKTLVTYRKRWCVRELQFESVNKVGSKNITLFLSVEHERPIDRLASIFDDETVSEVEVSDEVSDKIDDFLSSLGLEDDTAVEDDIEIEVVEEVPSYQSALEASFEKMKIEKIEEIKSRIVQKEKDIYIFEKDVDRSNKKVEDAKSELKLLEDRLETLQPTEPFNGYYFNVSERLNEKVELSPEIEEVILSKIKKIKGINSGAFMKLFENGEYQIRLSQKTDDGIIEVTDMSTMSEDIRKILFKVGIGGDVLGKTDNRLIYIGDMTWGQIVTKMVKMGFGQESEFDKMCGSNSFKSNMEEKEKTEENMNNEIKRFDEMTVESDGSLSWEDNDEWGEDEEEMYGEIKDDEFLFAIYEAEDATNESCDPKIVFSICPESDMHYDQHLEHLLKSKFPMIKALGDAFEEVQEAEFDICDEEKGYWGVRDVVDFLCKAGIKPSVKFQKIASDKDLQLLLDTVNELGHQNLLK